MIENSPLSAKDLVLRVRIPEEFVDEVLTSLVELQPIPINPDTMQPMFTPKEWLRHVVKDFLLRQVYQVKVEAAVQMVKHDTTVSADMVEVQEATTGPVKL